MEWSNAGKRTRLGPMDGSVLAPIILCLIVFHYTTIILLLVYAGLNAYITYRGRSVTWVLRRVRFFMRNGVVLARTKSYWRHIQKSSGV